MRHVEAAAQLMPNATPQIAHRVGACPGVGDGRVVGGDAETGREREEGGIADVEFEEGAEVEPAQEVADGGAEPECMVE